MYYGGLTDEGKATREAKKVCVQGLQDQVNALVPDVECTSASSGCLEGKCDPYSVVPDLKKSKKIRYSDIHTRTAGSGEGPDQVKVELKCSVAGVKITVGCGPEYFENDDEKMCVGPADASVNFQNSQKLLEPVIGKPAGSKTKQPSNFLQNLFSK